MTPKVLDINGKAIAVGDVCKVVATSEMLLVIKDSKDNLVAINPLIGLQDYLDVYPNEKLEVVGNALVSYEEA